MNILPCAVPGVSSVMETSFFPPYFTNSTVNFCVYILAASLLTAEAEAACQPCGSEEACELF